MSKVKIAAIRMCAGSSSRMGKENKLLLKLNNVSAVRNTAREISLAAFSEVINVTGFENNLLEEELEDFNFNTVRNCDFDKGFHSSIKVGVQRLSNDTEFFAICLGDQPALQSHDYNFLLDTVETFKDKKLFQPMFKGMKGNPAIISTAFVKEILEHADDDRGCYYLFEKYPTDVMKVEMPNDSALLDIDTPEQYLKMKTRLDNRGIND